jgi:hypothetical protein
MNQMQIGAELDVGALWVDERTQLAEVERLRQVMIAPSVESHPVIVIRIARRQSNRLDVRI